MLGTFTSNLKLKRRNKTNKTHGYYILYVLSKFSTLRYIVLLLILLQCDGYAGKFLLLCIYLSSYKILQLMTIQFLTLIVTNYLPVTCIECSTDNMKGFKVSNHFKVDIKCHALIMVLKTIVK